MILSFGPVVWSAKILLMPEDTTALIFFIFFLFSLFSNSCHILFFFMSF